MPATSTARELRFLDPAVIARLGTMELKARTVVEGFLSGLHRSPYKGFSVEFAEYRQYLPGDDLSTLDWKVYARSDRHYVKKFQEETNLECHLLLDISASMAYRGAAAMSKMEYGSVLAGSLAFLMNRQRDATGLIAFDDKIAFRLPAGARRGHLHSLLIALERLEAGRRLRCRRGRCSSWPRRWSGEASWCSSRICWTIRNRSSRDSSISGPAETTSSCFRCSIRTS